MAQRVGKQLFWMVALHEHERKAFVRLGESAYYSGLFVDDEGKLRVVKPSIGPESLSPFCSCCTHTFNGIVFSKTVPRDLQDQLDDLNLP